MALPVPSPVPNAALKPKAPTPVSSIPGVSPVTTPPMAQPGVAYSPINPASDLRSQTIGVGPTADRNKIAQDQINTWNASSEPQFQSDLRDATSKAAGAGQLGSGQLRTSLGNLTYNRDVQRNAAESNYLSGAQTGSIEDAYRNVGIAQQQQGRQDSAQNTSFGQGLQSLLAGSSGDPSSAQLALSGMYGGQAAQGQAGLSGLITGSVANSAAQTQQELIDQLLRGRSAPSPASTTIPNSGTYAPTPGSNAGVGGVFNNPNSFIPRY